MPRSRLSIIVWFVVSASALYAWWFAQDVVMHWAAAWKQAHSVSVPPEFSPAFDHRNAITVVFYAVCTWSVCLAGLTAVATEKLKWIASQLQAVSILSLLAATYVVAAASFGAFQVNRLQEEKLAVFEDTLKRFALLENAAGRWDKFISEVEAFQQLRLVNTRPVEEWSDYEVQEELEFLTRLFSEPSAEIQRMGLATMALFKERVAGNPKLTYTLRGLPSVASRLGLGSFNDPTSVLETVAAKNKEKEWRPLPLVRFEVRK
jgi:hypothetical protein